MAPINDLSDLNFPGKTVLIAEDEEISLYFLKELLKDRFAKILTATNGKEAVQTIESNGEIDLILMDIRMPIIDGLEATRIIRKTNKDVVIIAQTAYAMKNDREDAIAAGCNECVTKPISEDELFNKIALFIKN